MNIADKIKKLLALAQNNSNPEEAALAAAKAQELMVKYAIEEAQIAGTPAAAAPEPIESEPMGAGFKGLVQHWQSQLALQMAPSFFCRSYFAPRGDIFMVGRKSDREAFRATWLYLRGEIERMAACAYVPPSYLSGANLAGYCVKWKRAFSLGAAVTVGERLNGTMKQLAAASSTAIVLADRMKPVDAFAKSLGLVKSTGTPVNASGFHAGKQAGHTLNISKRAGASKRLAS